MGTPHVVGLRDRIIALCRGPTVAAQAGVSSAAWASTTSPHVFPGILGPRRDRNRGRMPFVEVGVESEDPAAIDQDGAEVTTSVILRVWVAGTDEDAANILAGNILAACCVAIRGSISGREGDDGPSEWHGSGAVWSLTRRGGVVESLDKSNYGMRS